MVTLIIEDGTRPTGANTYVSLLDANEYVTLYAEDPSVYENYDQEKAKRSLIQAAKVLDELYGTRYSGYIYPDATQTLLFPRSSFYTNTGKLIKQLEIPTELKNAQVELAMLIYDGFNPYVTRNRDGNILSKSVSVAGAISTSVSYNKASEDEEFTGMIRVERVLAPILQKKQKISQLHL